jgi:hypothetical protein
MKCEKIATYIQIYVRLSIVKTATLHCLFYAEINL